MTGPLHACRKLAVRFFILISCGLALLIAGPVPAQANGQCENRAWINVPLEQTLVVPPHIGEHENAMYYVALSKDYAVLGWRHQALDKGIYYFAVGTFASGAQGRKHIDWNLDDAHMMITDGVSPPAIAINDRNNVLIAIEDPFQYISWKACKVAHTGEGNPVLHCGKYNKETFDGTSPSVTLNYTASGEQQALITYEGWLFYSLFYRLGYFDEASLNVNWGNHHHYAAGHTPSIAMNNSSEVVETHHTANPFSNHLYIKVGWLQQSSGHIQWKHSHVYESSGLEGQSVALVDRAVIEFHQGRNPYGDKIYFRYGLIYPVASTVGWQGGTEKRRIGGSMCLMPQAAVNSQGDLLMAWKNLQKGPASHIFGGLGKLGYGWACPWPTVSTAPVSHVTGSAAQSGGEVTMEGDGPVTARGVCWSTSQNPTISDSHTSDGTRFGSFSSHLTGLSPDTTYYLRAYATNAYGTGYGEQVSFHSGKIPPKLWTLPPRFITTNSAWAGGAVWDQGEGPVTERGLCWSTAPNPTLNNPNLSKGSGLGAYYAKIEGLDPDTTYYVRAYATNRGGTSYGASLRFTTAHPSLPIVETADPSDLAAGSAFLGGDVSNEGSAPVSGRGVVWAAAPQPNLNNHVVPMGQGLGFFGQEVGGFAANTTYHVRAYAINSAGVSYGQEKMFSTTAGALPVVSTTAPYGQTTTSALSGGYVTNPGQTPVTARGVCWSASPNPDLTGAHTSDGEGVGEFHSFINGLAAETTYYVRAYATNQAGTAYGEQYSFRTVGPGYPVVQTFDIVELNLASAKVSGDVVSDGGAAVKTRGVCWSTSPHPTVDDKVVDSGSGLGQFDALISGLQPETAYYARAFATNQNGTSYGHVVTFRTTFCPYPCR